MPEEVFGRPLIEPWYAFLDGFCCPYTGGFSCERERFPSSIDGSVTPDREKEAGNESPKGHFLERMCEEPLQACLDRTMMNKRSRRGFAMADRFIHHIL